MFIIKFVDKIVEKREYYRNLERDNKKLEDKISRARVDIAFLKEITSGNKYTRTQDEIIRVTNRKLEEIEEDLER